MGIVGMIVVTLIGNCFVTGIIYSWVGVGLGFEMTGSARGIAHFRILAMDSTALVVVSP